MLCVRCWASFLSLVLWTLSAYSLEGPELRQLSRATFRLNTCPGFIPEGLHWQKEYHQHTRSLSGSFIGSEFSKYETSEECSLFYGSQKYCLCGWMEKQDKVMSRKGEIGDLQRLTMRAETILQGALPRALKWPPFPQHAPL